MTNVGYSGSIALSLNSAPAGGKLAGVLIEPVVHGVATFNNLSLNMLGGYTLIAASTSDLVAAALPLTVIPAPHFQVELRRSRPALSAKSTRSP